MKLKIGLGLHLKNLIVVFWQAQQLWLLPRQVDLEGLSKERDVMSLTYRRLQTLEPRHKLSTFAREPVQSGNGCRRQKLLTHRIVHHRFVSFCRFQLQKRRKLFKFCDIAADVWKILLEDVVSK